MSLRRSKAREDSLDALRRRMVGHGPSSVAHGPSSVAHIGTPHDLHPGSYASVSLTLALLAALAVSLTCASVGA